MNLPPVPDPVESWLELSDGQLFRLKDRCTIGRHADNDVVLTESSVSRHHALLASDADGYVLSDLESRNGTYVNRSQVTQVTALRDGDELHFGDSAARYRRTQVPVTLSLHKLPALLPRAFPTRESACWLLLANVDGYAEVKIRLGEKNAVQRFHQWVAGIRSLIERDGGTINRYVSDGIFAWWPANADSAKVRNVLACIEAWRPRSPVVFRVMLHHGSVVFTRSERGEELTGPEVNFVFRSDKVAKDFGAPAILSESATHATNLDGRCKALGATTMDGIRGRFVFFAPPPNS